MRHRKIIDSVFDSCKVEKHNIMTICSSVDKLDKTTWAEKSLEERKRMRLGSYFLNGEIELVQK